MLNSKMNAELNISMVEKPSFFYLEKNKTNHLVGECWLKWCILLSLLSIFDGIWWVCLPQENRFDVAGNESLVVGCSIDAKKICL